MTKDKLIMSKEKLIEIWREYYLLGQTKGLIISSYRLTLTKEQEESLLEEIKSKLAIANINKEIYEDKDIIEIEHIIDATINKLIGEENE